MIDVQMIGQRVRYYRKINSLTQRELAEKVGVSPSYIANIEQGQKRISLDKLVDICRGFSINLSDLLPITAQSDSDAKETMIGEIADSLRTLETKQVSLLKTMICSL